MNNKLKRSDMKKNFNILVGSAVMAGLLIGCGGSKDKDEKKKTDTKNCTYSNTSLKVTFDEKVKELDLTTKGVKVLDGAGTDISSTLVFKLADKKVTKLNVSKEGTSKLELSSDSCTTKSELTVTVAKEVPAVKPLVKPVLPGY